mmetsp:Transcript_45584/g.145172  ORF Transcript_45584/g.145172 Transcript_45584/m.145172 type:complete len:223 (+) Transcript_45584:1492-2160(+)
MRLFPMPRSSMSAPAPLSRMRVMPRARTVRHSWLRRPGSALTMWIGIFSVPSAASPSRAAVPAAAAKGLPAEPMPVAPYPAPAVESYPAHADEPLLAAALRALRNVAPPWDPLFRARITAPPSSLSTWTSALTYSAIVPSLCVTCSPREGHVTGMRGGQAQPPHWWPGRALESRGRPGPHLPGLAHPDDGLVIPVLVHLPQMGRLLAGVTRHLIPSPGEGVE